jgi:hypothetical protein
MLGLCKFLIIKDLDKTRHSSGGTQPFSIASFLLMLAYPFFEA